MVKNTINVRDKLKKKDKSNLMKYYIILLWMFKIKNTFHFIM